MPDLKRQVQDHCSYCDNYPVSPPSRETIDHFKPKSEFPREAYAWPNLYYCCDFCQQRPVGFSEDLLRPDGDGYHFDDYFSWDFTTGELRPNAASPPENQRRATATIKAFNLNRRHPPLRTRARRQWLHAPAPSPDDSAYRDYVLAPRNPLSPSDAVTNRALE